MVSLRKEWGKALASEGGGGGGCPECGGPGGPGGGRPPLIVMRRAEDGAFVSARQGGEEISEEELREIEENACSLCDKGPEINIGRRILSEEDEDLLDAF